MARWLELPCSLLLFMLFVATAVVADDVKCTTCGTPTPCGTECTYPSPPPPVLPPPEYYPPPPPTEYYPPTTPSANCPPPPYGGGGGYEPTPGYHPTPGYNPTPSGWFTPPNLPSYLTPPGTLYPQDPGFHPNAAAGSIVSWRAVMFTAAAVAGAMAL
ncbi:hypothetical protein ABZP36_026810 [Zizania latifolia]